MWTPFILWSFVDIRVDWQIFNLVENDSTLVDLLINIGEPFPLRDGNGVEIVPPSPERESPQPAVDMPEENGEAEVLTDATQPSLLSKVTEEMERSAGQGSEGKGHLISVVLREHEGEPAERGPFTVSHMQMVSEKSGDK